MISGSNLLPCLGIPSRKNKTDKQTINGKPLVLTLLTVQLQSYFAVSLPLLLSYRHGYSHQYRHLPSLQNQLRCSDFTLPLHARELLLKSHDPDMSGSLQPYIPPLPKTLPVHSTDLPFLLHLLSVVPSLCIHGTFVLSQIITVFLAQDCTTEIKLGWKLRPSFSCHLGQFLTFCRAAKVRTGLSPPPP